MNEADGTGRNAPKFRKFRERIKEAEGKATQRWLAIIERAANDGSWQAAAWKLERRRSMFVPKVRQEVTGQDGNAIQIESQAGEAREIIAAAISRFNGKGEEGEDIKELNPPTTH